MPITLNKFYQTVFSPVSNPLDNEHPCPRKKNKKSAVSSKKSQEKCENQTHSRLIRNSGSKRALLICSLNAPSLRKHKDEIEVLMRENKIDIFAINETKLDSKTKDEQVSAEGYNILRCDRNSYGGGVAIYLRDTLNYELRTDITTENLEMICIEMEPKCSKPFFVLAWYRPPKYETETLTEVNTLLETLEKEQKEIILIGYVNCNDLDLARKSKIIETLRDTYREYQLKQLIRNPTRSTVTTQTLIDHLATNRPKLIINSGVFTTGFSDHDLIFGIGKVSNHINREPKIIKSRQLKHYDPVKFCLDLQQIDSDRILQNENIHTMSSEFENYFVSVLDKHAPIRQHKVRNSYAPYIDHELRHKMFLRDFYKSRYKKTNDPEDWKQFQHFRNKINTERRKKKTEYFNKKLNENKGDIKGTWKVLNMAPDKRSKTTNFTTIKVNKKEISDQKEIGNALNNHFCTTADRVLEESRKQNPGNVPEFESFITKLHKPTKLFNFRKVSPAEVKKVIAKLKNSRAGKIPTRFLKDASDCIAFPLAFIFSKSLKLGIFPDNLKIARISAIFKGKRSRSDPDHYRPISVLSVIARLFGKIIHQQLYYYIKGSLSNTQSGFKSGYSTETSLLNTTIRWILNIDKKYCNLTLFLDLQNTFDTVAHDILIKKLDLYGIRGTELAWFKSYLSNRLQYCCIDGINSD